MAQNAGASSLESAIEIHSQTKITDACHVISFEYLCPDFLEESKERQELQTPHESAGEGMPRGRKDSLSP